MEICDNALFNTEIEEMPSAWERISDIEKLTFLLVLAHISFVNQIVQRLQTFAAFH